MAAYAALYRKILTLFDHVPPHVINLGMGSPSDALLKGCTQVLKNATAHRMVSSYNVTILPASQSLFDIILLSFFLWYFCFCFCFCPINRSKMMHTCCFSMVLRLVTGSIVRRYRRCCQRSIDHLLMCEHTCWCIC